MTSPQDAGELQFDSVVPRVGDGAAASADTRCTLCQTPIESEYFDVNGQTVCRACSESVAHQATTPRDIATLLRGLGLLWIVGAVAVWRAVWGQPGPGHNRTLFTYQGLVVILALLARNVQ